MDNYSFTATKDGCTSPLEINAHSEALAVADLKAQGYTSIEVGSCAAAETNFHRVAAMNEAFGNRKGNPKSINLDVVRSQTRNILDEFCEVQIALGASQEAVLALREAAKGIRYSEDVSLDDVRDGLCDIHVFAYGAHHLMGIDADKDMSSVVDGVMTRFIKDEADKQATIAKHAAKGVTDVYFEGEYPVMVMKSAVDQPDAPKGKFLKSASYSEPVFHQL